MIIFQVSLNFDPLREIPITQCQSYILMKRVIFLRKTYVIMKSFAPPFFLHFSLSLNRKKPCNESHEKATTHIHADLLHIRTGNPHWCKGRPCKNKGKK